MGVTEQAEPFRGVEERCASTPLVSVGLFFLFVLVATGLP
jgi:hypothetical protein